MVCNVDADYSCNILVYSVLGQVLSNKVVHLQRGQNIIEVTSSFQKNQVGVVVLVRNNVIWYSEKTVL